MALRFYLGRSGSGKSYRLAKQIIEESLQHPEQNFLILVPEQFSMQMQSELVRLHPHGGILNIDVLSLNRLAYRIFEETGANTHELLEESGKSLVLRRISLDFKNEMPYLGAHLRKPGSITEIKSVLSELMQYGVTPDRLLGDTSSYSPQLIRKLSDIAALMTEYKAYCSEHFMNAEEVPSFLAKQISRSAYLKNCTVALDGFTGFTPVQLPVIRELLTHARNVLVTATIDETYAQPGYSAPDLFSMSRTMISALENLAREAKTAVLPPVYVESGEKSRLARCPSIAFLEQHLFRPHRGCYTKKDESIRIDSFENPTAEVRAAARAIRRMVRLKGFRYRDMAVISGDPALYGDLIRRIFPEYGIPFFVDEKRPALHNPYIEFLRAAMQIFTDGWSPEAVFRFLRTGFTELTRDEIDLLENYVLALGIRSKKRWSESWTIHYPGQDKKELMPLNALREKVLALLQDAQEEFSASRSSAQKKTEVLYRLSVRCGVQQKLADEELALRDAGKMALAGEYARIYAIVMSLFDKTADILGDRPVSAKDYRALLETSFTETRIGITPPTGDQVMAGDVERSRLSSIHALFFLGVSDGNVPHPPAVSGLLTEADRECLAASGIELSPPPPEEILRQRFYLYLALTKPDRYLRISFARTDVKGAAVKPSYLIRRLQSLFPNMPRSDQDRVPLSDIETPLDGLHELPFILGETLTGAEKDRYMELYRTLLLHDPEHPVCALLPAAAAAKRRRDDLSEAGALSLYGKTLRNSVSRLETFASCPFRHFAAYGLRLKERPVFTLSGADRGTVLHKALLFYAEQVRKKGLRWQDLPEEEQLSLADESVDRAAADYMGRILYDTAGNRYELTRMKRMMRRTVRTLTAQLERGDFEPSGFEQRFRETEELSSMSLTPAAGASMLLTGAIDRLDICAADDSTLVKIIDYKTGSTEFDLFRVANGLQLQLLVYLRAAQELLARRTGRLSRAAGIFYYNINDPVIEVDPGASPEEKETARLKALIPNGLTCGDPGILRHLDRGLGSDYSESSVIPVKLGKDGSPKGSSGVVSGEELTLLTLFAKKKADALASEIMHGQADPLPYRVGTESACEYCPFENVCGFDRRIPGYGFRDLDKKDSDALMEEITRFVTGENAGSISGKDTKEISVENAAGISGGENVGIASPAAMEDSHELDE